MFESTGPKAEQNNITLCNMNIKEQKSSPETGKMGLYTYNICFCYNKIDIVEHL